jgi:hypothetical protein
MGLSSELDMRPVCRQTQVDAREVEWLKGKLVKNLGQIANGPDDKRFSEWAGAGKIAYTRGKNGNFPLTCRFS